MHAGGQRLGDEPGREAAGRRVGAVADQAARGAQQRGGRQGPGPGGGSGKRPEATGCFMRSSRKRCSSRRKERPSQAAEVPSKSEPGGGERRPLASAF